MRGTEESEHTVTLEITDAGGAAATDEISYFVDPPDFGRTGFLVK